MKKYVFPILGCVCVLLIVCGIKRIREKDPMAWVRKNQPLISHACGGLWETDEDGNKVLVTYSNSAEALEKSLENGIRLIEADFMMTTDGVLACTHGWPSDLQQESTKDEAAEDGQQEPTRDDAAKTEQQESTKDDAVEDGQQEPTRDDAAETEQQEPTRNGAAEAEQQEMSLDDSEQDEQEQEGQAVSSEVWKTYKINGKYTSQTLEDILQAMMEYPDMYLITDIKSQHSVEETKEEFKLLYEQAEALGGRKLLKRIIPQIYNAEMYDVIKEVYDWQSVIFTLYELDDVPDEDILAFIHGKEDIPVVTVPKRRMSKAFSDEIHSEGKLVFCHTLDSVEGAQKYIKKGADGIYTNAILPTEAAELW